MGMRERPVAPPKSWLMITLFGLIQVTQANTLRKGAMKPGNQYQTKEPIMAYKNIRYRPIFQPATLLGSGRERSCSAEKRAVLMRVEGQIMAAGWTRNLVKKPAMPKPSI